MFGQFLRGEACQYVRRTGSRRQFLEACIAAARHQLRRHRRPASRRFRALVCGAQMSSVRKTHGDAAIEEENRTIDRKVNSICRGC